MKYTNVNIGQEIAGGYAPQFKPWITTAIGAGLSLASSLFGGSKSEDYAEKAYQAQIKANKRARDAEEAWYQRKMNESYVDTAAGQALINRAKEFAKEQNKRAEGQAAVAGATEAATAMSKEAGNKMVGETIANMAAQDTARKDRADEIHHNAEQSNIKDEGNITANYLNTKSQNVSQAASGASNALMGIGTAIAQGIGGKTSLTGGNNGGNASDPAAAAAAMARNIKWGT